jgi:hypothetical protein
MYKGARFNDWQPLKAIFLAAVLREIQTKKGIKIKRAAAQSFFEFFIIFIRIRIRAS